MDKQSKAKLVREFKVNVCFLTGTWIYSQSWNVEPICMCTSR